MKHEFLVTKEFVGIDRKTKKKNGSKGTMNTEENSKKTTLEISLMTFVAK